MAQNEGEVIPLDIEIPEPRKDDGEDAPEVAEITNSLDNSSDTINIVDNEAINIEFNENEDDESDEDLDWFIS